MQFNLVEMFGHMGLPAIMVAGVLSLMGMASLTVFLERVLMLRTSRRASRQFADATKDAMASGQLEIVVGESERHKRSHLAKVVSSGLTTFRHAQQTHDVSGLTPIDRTQRHMERFMEEISADLRRGLTVLASVGSTAPFVGLLGTVLGIISAFQGIAATGSGGLSSVSAGISEALVETALGLIVAIPAVLGFNYLTTEISREEQTLNHASSQMLDTLEDWAERLGSGTSRPVSPKDRAPVVASGSRGRVESTRLATGEALA